MRAVFCLSLLYFIVFVLIDEMELKDKHGEINIKIIE